MKEIVEWSVGERNYWVYVLLSSKDKKFYIGLTNDLPRRLREHLLGQVVSTKNRRPLKLVHYEFFIFKNDARSREVFLKSGFGRDQLRQSLKTTLSFLGVGNYSDKKISS